MKYWIIGIVALVLIAVFVGLFVPLSEVAYAQTVEYQDTETYYFDENYTITEPYQVTEPYQDIETYTVSEPYKTTESYLQVISLTYKEIKKYEEKGSYQQRNQIIIGGTVVQDEVVTVYYPITCVDIKNTDTSAGRYSLSFTLYALNKKINGSPVNVGDKYTGYTHYLLSPGETKTFKVEFPEVNISTDNYSWEYTISPGTKSVENIREVTKYKDVEKTREVTKYKEVTKTRQVEMQRPVTKQRTETRYKKVPLFEKWFK